MSRELVIRSFPSSRGVLPLDNERGGHVKDAARRLRMRASVLGQHSSDTLDDPCAQGSAKRPSMPPLTILALALWGACAGSYTLGFRCARDFLIPLIFVACVFFALAIFALMRGAPPTLAVLTLGLAIGCALGFSATFSYITKADQVIASPVQEWCFTAEEDARQGDFGATVHVVAHSELNGEEHAVSVTLPKGESDIFYGDSFSATCALSQPREASAERFFFQGTDAVSSPGAIERLDNSCSLGGVLANVRKSAIALFDGQGDTDALCQALVCGYREQLREADLYAACKTVGVAHLVAVSGAHLSITCGMIASALQVVRTPRRFSLAIQLSVLSIYLVLTGMPISALRAAAMAIVGMMSFLARRRRTTLSALGACIVVIITISPQSSVSISFFLSAISTLGIIALMPLISSWLSAVPIVRRIAEPLALTLAAMAATTPFSAALFSQLPLVSPVANLVVAPLFTIALLSSSRCCAVRATLRERSSFLACPGDNHLRGDSLCLRAGIAIRVVGSCALDCGAASALALMAPAHGRDALRNGVSGLRVRYCSRCRCSAF